MLKLHIRSTWGCAHYVGLTNITVLGPRGQVLPLKGHLCKCFPPSVHQSVEGMDRDVRRVERLVDGDGSSRVWCGAGVG